MGNGGVHYTIDQIGFLLSGILSHTFIFSLRALKKMAIKKCRTGCLVVSALHPLNQDEKANEQR